MLHYLYLTQRMCMCRTRCEMDINDTAISCNFFLYSHGVAHLDSVVPLDKKLYMVCTPFPLYQ